MKFSILPILRPILSKKIDNSPFRVLRLFVKNKVFGDSTFHLPRKSYISFKPA